MAKKKKAKKKTKKKTTEILYHYCSNDAFHSIIENKSIRLSSLSQSNDWKEGKLVVEIIGLIAKGDNLSKVKTEGLLDIVSFLEDMVDGLGFCLSNKGDLLSQWRGYADDATGVSIGFSKDFLKQFAKSTIGQEVSELSLNRVVYGYKSQEKLLKPAYKEFKKLIDDGGI